MVNTYKVVLCGKTGVGKTSIFRRVCELTGCQCKQYAGKTAKNHERQVKVEVEGTTVEFNLWDTAGLETHAVLTRSHFLLSQAVLFVYSATDKDSLSQALELLNLARIDAQGAFFILIRNKIDLDATVSEDDVMASIPHNVFALQFKTSAETGEGIQEMLQSVASHLLRRATPMKSIGRQECVDRCLTDSAAQYTRNGSNEMIRLQIEDGENASPRKKKCCFH